eukprot:m.793318 g.793318  ORF g.793318 m.793318 type:complete len:74 (-) comp59228_c0_seq4:2849-3070(-)
MRGTRQDPGMSAPASRLVMETKRLQTSESPRGFDTHSINPEPDGPSRSDSIRGFEDVEELREQNLRYQNHLPE